MLTTAGDKETYWPAKEMLGESDYAFHEGGVAAIGRTMEKADNEAAQRVCSKQLVHLDRAGRPLWFNGGLHAFNEIAGQETAFGFNDGTLALESGCADPDGYCWS
jgi:alpha 1,3-mannosyltransferase